MKTTADRRLSKWTVGVWIAGALILALPQFVAKAVGAESDEISALRQRVAELERTVQTLQGKLEALERVVAHSPEPVAAESSEPRAAVKSPPATPEPTLRDRWRNLERGMTLQQVESLLGRPQRIMSIGPQKGWYYSYPDVGSGSVVFGTDESVIDWQVPPFSVWW